MSTREKLRLIARAYFATPVLCNDLASMSIIEFVVFWPLEENPLNPLPHRDASKHFCKQSRPRSGSSYGSCLIRVYSVCFRKYDKIGIDPTLVDMTNNFFVLCRIMKVYLYIIIHSGWSLA